MVERLQISLEGRMARTMNSEGLFLALKYVGLPALLFFAVDCGFGVKGTEAGVVVDRMYVPLHTTQDCDKNGCSTNIHPPKYTLVVGIKNNEDFVDVDVKRNDYYRTKQNQQVTVNFRQGKITKMYYFPSVDKGSW